MKSQISGIWSLCFLLGLLLQSCGEGSVDTAGTLGADYEQFTMLSSAETGIDFENKVIEKPNLHLGFYDYYYNGSGVAAGDFNNDGLVDLFFCGNHADNTLYLNEGGFKFKDVTAQAGIQPNGIWSTGVTLVDINEDGWLDIYVSNSGPTNDRQLLANQLYVNNQNGTFTEKAAEYGIADDSRSTQSAFFDMDNDGDLDLIVMNHSLRNRDGNAVKWHATFAALDPKEQEQDINTLYRNEGAGKFTDITREAGLFKPGFGLGLSIADFDQNGFLDIYIANDYFIPDFFYMNQGNGTFLDKVKSHNSHISFYSMGCDAADINNDGLIDLAVVDMTPADHFRNKTLMASMNVDQFTWLNDIQGFAPQYMFNMLQLNRGYGVFSEIGLMGGVSQTDWSWAALLADFDNDGFKDFMVTNGYYRDTKDNDWRIGLQERYKKEGKSPATYYQHLLTANSQPIPNYMYRNKGDLTFEDVSAEWKIGAPSFSHGAVYVDLDKDGDLDIVTNNLSSKAFILKNNDREKGNSNYIRFKLTAGKTINDCLYSKVKIFYGEEQQVVEYSFTRGYQSYVEPAAHFGLGEVAAVDRVEVHWTDGTMTTMQQPAINKTHLIDKNAVQRSAATAPDQRSMFMNISNQQRNITFKHQENDYNDFATEVLLPHQQSKLGPCVAVADVNGDGLEDFYVGGAKGQAGALYLQPGSMVFEASAQPAFNLDAGSEDLGALFFDADQDGDQDLYVASGGGGAFRDGAKALQDRLYLNDGKGNFTKSSNALPRLTSSTAVVEASDWDKDGDLDLLVGGRTFPGMYPHHPQSYLLQNDGGKFTDVTAELYPGLERIGMITDASWTDIDGDGWEDLMIVGEWMPVTCL
ncbi:MAG: VCBS repeat-containing protein, partial [Phaeodactylibacter sp.]|nr:VCBS repeat-containing protein [Phaeodactylibacter sp.]